MLITSARNAVLINIILKIDPEESLSTVMLALGIVDITPCTQADELRSSLAVRARLRAVVLQLVKPIHHHEPETLLGH